MFRTIVLCGREITYELQYKKVRNVNLRIRKDGSVFVSCNRRTSIAYVEAFMKEKERFIVDGIDKTLKKVDNANRPESYEDGEAVNVFGMRKTLRFLEGSRSRVTVSGDEVIVELKGVEDKNKRFRVYNNWKRELLKREILDVSEEIFPYFKLRGVNWPQKITYRTMKSRWGSCKPSGGVLTFNYNLFETPPECIRYVVVHEFAHFLEANHSDRFYVHVGNVMPDYKKWRKLLNEY